MIFIHAYMLWIYAVCTTSILYYAPYTELFMYGCVCVSEGALFAMIFAYRHGLSPRSSILFNSCIVAEGHWRSKKSSWNWEMGSPLDDLLNQKVITWPWQAWTWFTFWTSLIGYLIFFILLSAWVWKLQVVDFRACNGTFRGSILVLNNTLGILVFLFGISLLKRPSPSKNICKTVRPEICEARWAQAPALHFSPFPAACPATYSQSIRGVFFSSGINEVNWCWLVWILGAFPLHDSPLRRIPGAQTTSTALVSLGDDKWYRYIWYSLMIAIHQYICEPEGMTSWPSWPSKALIYDIIWP